MIIQSNLIDSHRSHFVETTMENARCDLDEARRQLMRASNKLLAISGTGEIRKRLNKLYEFADDIDDDLEAIISQSRNKAELLREMPVDKGEAYEVGLFAMDPPSALESKTEPIIA